jgi:hypothetical protein
MCSATLVQEDIWMYTSLVLLVLANGMIPAPRPDTPAWLSDYGAACRRGKAEKKPLAVFFGKGETGWEQVSKDGPLGEGAVRLLQAEYVPLYLDVETDYGRRMASAFGVKGVPALVISDRSGESLALRYSGTLGPADLRSCLARYADPDRVVRTTDTDPTAAEPAPESYRAALAAARREDRPLLLVFHAERCLWCKRMEHDTFADGRVKAALRPYVVYVVDTDREPAVTRKYLPPMSPIPAYCLVNTADETVRKDGNSYRTAEEFLAWLD